MELLTGGQGRHVGRYWVAVALTWTVGGSALRADKADAPVGRGRPERSVPAWTLLAPTQGRPVFVAPGGSFRAALEGSEEPPGIAFELVRDSYPVHRHHLRWRPIDSGSRVLCCELFVPSDTPPATYDLVVNVAGRRLTARHAVAVQNPPARLRLVHLSDMNTDGLAVPEFDEQLVQEVNLLGPTLVVLTGDMLDVTHPDPDGGWQRLSDYLARFEAPTLVACGDNDDPLGYAAYLAPSPLGTIEIGRYRGVVLYDLPRSPISEDADQVAWVEETLLEPGPTDLCFMVAHDSCPNLLRYWRQQGRLADVLTRGRVGLYFAGGHRDWDGHEYADLVTAAHPLWYVRTHQSSRALIGGAGGVSHYRVIDVQGTQARHVGPWSDDGQPASIAVGGLTVSFDGPNDGRRRRLAVTVSSRLPVRLDNLTVRVLVQSAGDKRPWCHGARLRQVLDLGNIWECRLAFDLPDCGLLRAVVGTDAEPALPAVTVEFDGPAELLVHNEMDIDAVAWHVGVWPGTVRLSNRGPGAVEFTPLVRLDGQVLAYRVVSSVGPFAAAYRLRLQPGQTVELQIEVVTHRIRPGLRDLQVYVGGETGLVPACWPLTVKALP